MNTTKFAAFVVSFVALALGTALLIEHQARSKLEKEVAVLRVQLAELAALQQEFASRPAQTPEPGSRPHSAEIDLSELMRLRAEVSGLQERLTQVERASAVVSNRLAEASGANAPFVYADSTKRKDYAFSGYSAPQSAFQSMLWAITQSDVRAYRESLGSEMAAMFAEQCKDMPEGVMPGGFKNGMMYKASGFRVLDETPISDDETRLKVFLEGRQNIVLKLVFKKIDGEWKHARNE